MKHIVLYSGGAASSYTAYLVSKKVPKKDIILLHTPTHSEDPDSDRFRKDVSDFLGIPITEEDYGMDIWELIDKNKALPSTFMPFCTQILKMKMTEKFLKKLDDDFIQYIGYSKDEWKRVQRTYTRNLQKGRKVKFPVYDSGLTDTEIKNIIKNDWGIRLPEAYKYLKHNNCIPCFKAGKYEWKNYWLHYPVEYEKAVQKEKEIGYTVFKDISLEELREKFRHNKEFEDKQITMDIPCMCTL